MQLAGRDTELDALVREVEQATAASAGRSLFLQGPSGIGKTSLAEALLEHLRTSRPEIAVARGACASAEGSELYHPFVAALKDLSAGVGPARSNDSVAALVAELAPYWLSVVPLVGSLLSAGMSTALRLRARKPPSQDALFRQYLSVVERLASSGPLVLLLDDLQHADPASVALLAHLARGVRGLPVAILGTLPDASALGPHPVDDLVRELERERLARRIPVGELRGEAFTSLLRLQLGGDAAPKLCRWLEEATGGNPRFAGELCRLLVETGGAVQRQGLWHLDGSGEGLAVPRSAEAVIDARLQHLGESEIRMLQYASVQGNEFQAGVLAELLEDDELAVLDRLAEIERQHGLVLPAGDALLPGGDMVTLFRFASAPVQTVLYRQVIGKRRILLHRRVGEVLERLYGEDPVPIAHQLALHFREGRQEERAAHFERIAESVAARCFAAEPKQPGAPAAAAEPRAADAGGESPTASNPADTPNAFVGREAELEQLLRAVRESIELGAGRSIFVQGPPGAGKTTLVNELLERFRDQGVSATIARGRCLQTFGSADPYLPFVDAVRDLSDEEALGFTESERFVDLLADIAPFWISAVPAVGSLLSAALGTARALRTQPQPQAAPSREALFAQYTDLIGRLARRSPLVLFLDDLHWADHASVALLSHLARGIGTLPVVLIGTLRNEEVEREQHPVAELIRSLEQAEQAVRVQVEELSGDALDGLLRAEFGGDVSEPLRRLVLETAGGNPLFASEFCRLLRQSGAVRERLGEWFLTESPDRLEVPRSAEAVIESRVRRLDPSALRLLQYASVAGAEFDALLLSRLLDRSELSVLDALDELQRRHQLVLAAGQATSAGGEAVPLYRFRHALVQTVVYRRLSGRRRVLLHRQAGDALESLLGEQAAGKLARHFHQGRVGAKAYRYACTAAQSARRVFAHWEAEELFRIALEHSPSATESAALQERLGDVYDTVGYYAQAVACYRDACDRLPETEPAVLRLHRKTLFTEKRAGLISSGQVLERVQALLDRSGSDPRERCHLLLILSLHPDCPDPLESLQKAIDIAETLDEPSLLAQALELFAMKLVFSARTREAFPHLARALQVSDVESDPVRAARNFNIAGIGYAKLGAYPDALQAFERMLAICERIGDSNGVGCASGCIGNLLMQTGDFAGAERALQRVRTIQERRDRATSVHSLFLLGECARMRGQWSEAVPRFEALLQRARELGLQDYEAVALSGIGLCSLQRDEASHAVRRYACEVERILGDRDGWFEDREILEIFLARMEEVDGDTTAATARLARAAAALRSADIYLWARLETERARILGREDPTAARRLLDEVAAAVAAVESPPLHAQLAEVRRQVEAAPRPALAAAAR